MTVKKVTAATLAVVLAAAAFPVFAAGNVHVHNTNWASVGNVVVSGANTGGNTAGGSTGGDGGNGGNIQNEGGTQNVNNAGTGHGGMGGDAGMGGEVNTGDATSDASVDNDINNNHTEVDLCGCEPTNPEQPPTSSDVKDGDVEVMNDNGAEVGNAVIGDADTGSNTADGSTGGHGGRGGKIKNYSGSETGPVAPGTQNVNNASTGDGGNGGMGDAGGLVKTGKAKSTADAVNKINHNWTRVVR